VLKEAKGFTLDSLIAAAYDSHLTAFEPLVPQLLKDHEALPASDAPRRWQPRPRFSRGACLGPGSHTNQLHLEPATVSAMLRLEVFPRPSIGEVGDAAQVDQGGAARNAKHLRLFLGRGHSFDVSAPAGQDEAVLLLKNPIERLVL